MKQFPLLILMLILTAGCSKFGQRLLGVEKDDPVPPPPALVYEQSGGLTGDYTIYGDPKFRNGTSFTVEVCNEDKTDCQFLPHRNSVPRGEPSYLVASGGLFVNYVISNMPGMRRWSIKVYN